MTEVHGVSLHFYKERANSDKFWRGFIWADGGMWFANYHWGRDGQVGMTKAKPQSFHTRERAWNAVAAKAQKKIGEGYQFLGEGDLDIDIVDGQQVGAKLHERVGKEPTKLPDGFGMLIKEVDCIEDLI